MQLGLGLEAMRVLAMRGARVVGTARTLEKAREACASVGGTTVPLACELADPASVRACVASVQSAGLVLDALVCNAGIMALPNLQQAHGYELQFFTNHIGHFMLVTGLLGSLAEAGRVVVVSSDAHRAAPKGGIEWDNLSGDKRYAGWRNYGQSKVANILFASELTRRFDGTKQTANSLHPGVIKTNLVRNMSAAAALGMKMVDALALKSIPQGAATEVYLAVHPGAAGVSGKYYADCNEATPRADGTDAESAKRLWETSETIVAGLG